MSGSFDSFRNKIIREIINHNNNHNHNHNHNHNDDDDNDYFRRIEKKRTHPAPSTETVGVESGGSRIWNLTR
jgi:hypothetical protein